jgi:hypothetical protein
VSCRAWRLRPIRKVISTRSARRRGAGIILTIAAALVVTSCDSGDVFYTDSIEVQLHDGGVTAIAVCDPLHIDVALGDVRRKSGGETEPFWKASGSADVDSGATGVLGKSPFGLAAEIDSQPMIHAGDVVTVDLIDNTGTAAAYGSFVIDDPDRVSGLWLNMAGDVSPFPCANRDS